MPSAPQHIPHLPSITSFYQLLRIGQPQGDDFAIMRIGDQPDTKRLEIPLFRCSFYRLVIIDTSGVEWHLPEQALSSSKHCLYFSYPGKLESWLTNTNITGYLVCFTADFLESPQALPLQYLFFSFEGDMLLQLSVTEAAALAMQQEEMITEMSRAQADTKEMLRILLQRYLLSVRRLYTAANASQPTQVRNEHLIFQRFRQALDQYYQELAEDVTDIQPNVSTLADQLHLNASYLNTVIKNLTGNTASQFIQRKAILEAKSYLLHTNLPITSIAYQLGFHSPSYFNRFFKKLTGTTPTIFRKKNL